MIFHFVSLPDGRHFAGILPWPAIANLRHLRRNAALARIA
jgi:hypothetical protein